MGLAGWALSHNLQPWMSRAEQCQGWEGKLPEGSVHLDPASPFWGREVEKVHRRETGLSY